jgi:hypothetical protein
VWRWIIERHAEALRVFRQEAEDTLRSLARMQVKPYAEVAPVELEYPVAVNGDFLSSLVGNSVHFS